MFDPQVLAVQTELLRLGYVGVGPADGELGPKTEAAILNFKNRAGAVPRELVAIDADLIGMLAAAPRIVLPPGQTGATAAEIAPKVAAVHQVVWAKFWAKVSVWSSALGGFLIGIINNLGDAVGVLTPIKGFLQEFLASVPPLALVLGGLCLLCGVSALLAYKNRLAETALVAGYRTSALHDDNPERNSHA